MNLYRNVKQKNSQNVITVFILLNFTGETQVCIYKLSLDNCYLDASSLFSGIVVRHSIR